MKNLGRVIDAKHLCQLDKVDSLDPCIPMVLLYECVGLEDVVRERLRIVLVQRDQSVGLQNIRMSSLLSLLQVPKAKLRVK